jgi:hypothetical protein
MKRALIGNVGVLALIGTMSRKRVLAVSLLLPLMAIAGAAQADARASGKSPRWPAQRAAPDAYSAYGFGGYGGAAPLRDIQQYGGRPSGTCTYQGGPKSLFWTCR